MLILLAASVAMGLSVRFRVPSIPLMIGTGIVLGSLGWMGSVEDMQNAAARHRVPPVRRRLLAGSAPWATRSDAAIGFGLVQIALLGGISVGVSMLLGFDIRASLYIGLAIASRLHPGRRHAPAARAVLRVLRAAGHRRRAVSGRAGDPYAPGADRSDG